jgi:2-polyprenyl-6-hydroxyphenyl methylase/3-demethylubiquinone-9 3-methyltransferase
LHSITAGHHWKEYSLREIADYFGAISPDFRVLHREHYSYRDLSNSYPLYRRIFWIQEHLLPQTFRSELFVAIEVQKNQGIQFADPDEAVS